MEGLKKMLTIEQVISGIKFLQKYFKRTGFKLEADEINFIFQNIKHIYNDSFQKSIVFIGQNYTANEFWKENLVALILKHTPKVTEFANNQKALPPSKADWDKKEKEAKKYIAKINQMTLSIDKKMSMENTLRKNKLLERRLKLYAQKEALQGLK